jgi:centromere/kinetochore protein ZW10
MSVDEAESTAKILKIVEELDDLFICKPSGPSGNRNATAAEDSIPMTAQFADKWMKMKFLNETLQSNLNDIKFLWFESDLSLYFTVDEVVELIGLSFENNPSVRAAIREIRDRPYPREEA